MNRFIVYIPLALQFAGTLLLLSVVCIPSTELPSGELAGQWQWLSYTCMVYTACIGISLLFYSRKKNIRKNEYRILDYAYVVVWAFIFLGGWEAIVGLRQLYGFAYSNHFMFALTGSFFNPGPYSGYLAMVFPLCLSEHYQLKEKAKVFLPAKVGYYLAMAVFLLMLCVLPAGMSRSAWLSAGISALLVVGYYNRWGKKLNALWLKKRKTVIAWGTLVAICLIIGLTVLFYLKKDSANGRLFMWKISLHAIAEKPFTGHGAGSFPATYGNAQEAYFGNGAYADWEEHVAGSPEYAFNEYLQIAVEWGIPVLLVCLLIIGFCFWFGWKKHRIGICGSILSLGIFSFSSYPLQLPPFVVALFVLLFACIAEKSRLWLVSFSFVIALCGLYLWKNDDYIACKTWTQVRMLYNIGAFESAKKEYTALYPALKNRREFMFEYGRCLNKLGEYKASNQILQEALLVTCDPMVLNVMGKNYQEQEEYEEAEMCFLRSVNRLPGRIYPYYLLAKLYAEPNYNQPDKLERAAQMVMWKEPKVQSTAIKEMRTEIQEIVERNNLIIQKNN